MSSIIIKGAREHNLKNVNVVIPRDKLTVITGLSGSGKSSLAFDTIYSEGQRRYVESLSAYARQFLGQMQKPDVDSIEGLSPAISIEQKTIHNNPRSTVGTITEIYDYFRLLFSRVGTPYCYNCGRPIEKQSASSIVKSILSLPQGTKIILASPLVQNRKGAYRNVLEQLQKEGYARVRIDKQVYNLLEDEIKLDKNKKHSIEVIVDRLIIRTDIKKRLSDSVETALNLSEGHLILLYDDKEHFFSQHLSCPYCNISYGDLTPAMFSFNNPYGACPVCTGLGVKMQINPDLLIPNKNLSIKEGAIKFFGFKEHGYFSSLIKTLARKYKFSLSTPFRELTPKIQNIILYGTDSEIKFSYSSQRFEGNYYSKFEGLVNNLERRYKETKSQMMRNEISKYMSSIPCSSCHGQRLKPEPLAVKINGLNIMEVSAFSIEQALSFFQKLKLNKEKSMIAKQVLKEIKDRLSFLHNVGLGYLTLDRSAGTLSGGEAQRIRLATQIGTQLVGVTYILDVPSIGLHQKDNQKLLESLITLRDIGNTLIVIEHDQSTMEVADFIIDMGPGAGEKGGKIISQGTVNDLKKDPNSITGLYLSGKKIIPFSSKRRKGNGKKILLTGAQEHNLKSINVELPLGKFIVITGVSGSGKSTLINDILYPELSRRVNRSYAFGGKHKSISGVEHIDKVINIDQSPIGRTPRSNPATYTGVFTPIRELFTKLPDSKVRGYKPGRFSFNVPGGRCEACEGDGVKKIEMHFLPDVYITCEECHGKRFNDETLEIKYHHKTIADVLSMTVEEALSFFENIPAVKNRLQTLFDVGLGYIRLGQSATTLSGGEAQRIKLASELSKRSTGKTIYLLDEPTTGLHFEDIKQLLVVLNRFVDSGNTVIVIEHNLDVIKTADHIIDLGPEGGDKGGEIVAQGTPEEVAKEKKSYTGQFLKNVLK